MNPYLSVVMGLGGVVGEDLIARFQKSTANTLGLAEVHHLPLELVVVHWNFPDGVYFDFAVPLERRYTAIRVIHAPAELHKQVPNPHGFRYFEWYPKNIGIRRARGEFVLSTNPDDLFSSEMFAYFAERKLERGYFYRAHRHDVGADGKVFRICYPTGVKRPDATEAEIRISAPNAAPWAENMIHYNASGDFTLMHREDWALIHGNPEREYNHSVDGQTLYLAHTKGLKQIVLPFPFYHPDHVRNLNHAYAPEWDDNAPHTKENGEDWGFAGAAFQEMTL